MKIIVPTAGPTPDQRAVDYVVNIAKRLNAQLIALRLLTENETEKTAEKILRMFIEHGKQEHVSVNGVIKRGEIAPVIIEVAKEQSVDLIILGVSHGEIVAEWLNAKAMGKTNIPVLLIPKWVPTVERSQSNGRTRDGIKSEK